MKRKLMIICIALSAFAVSSASSASAVQLTYPTGTKLATGSKLLWTNVGNTKLTNGSGEVLQECAKLYMTGALLHNGADDITSEISIFDIEGTGSANRCTPVSVGELTSQFTANVEGGLPYCLTTTKETDKWEVRGGSCGSPRSIKVKFDFYNFTSDLKGTCVYERPNLTGTFTTDTAGQDAQLTIGEEGAFKRIEFPIILAAVCPEQTKLNAILTMETDTGPTADPLYLS
jgi:hypothetical protein